MNRYAARIGSAVALFLAATAAPAFAAGHASYIFQGKRITLTQIVDRNGEQAVSIDDPGLRTLFNDVGATVTFQSGGRYVLVTTGEPAVISFAIGDTRYDVGPVTETAAFAPFTQGGHAYVPLPELLQGLELAVKPAEGTLVIQPQLASLDLQSADGGTKLVAHGGIPLDARVVSQSADRIAIAFDGVGSMLPVSRTLDGGAVRQIDVRTSGSADNPTTTVTLYLAPGSSHSALGTDDQRDVTIGFDGAQPSQSVAQSNPVSNPEPTDNAQPTGNAQPAASPSESASNPSSPQLAQVTGVQTQAQNGSVLIRVAVDGPASYDWHRLRPPDNRWWIDVHGARLTAPSDEPGGDIVSDVRSHQEDADTVRVALSLSDYDVVTVTPDAAGFTIQVSDRQADVASEPRSGSGTMGQNAVANVQPAPSPGWKFAPRPAQSSYAAANPRLIVIDPGHGGSDFGAIRGDMNEKTVNLDMSKRLRDILVARGWQVVMTRSDDRDVYAPNDTAQQELQARDDIANTQGARLLVSVHSNSYINDGPHGTTVYFYKSSDYALAQALDRRIASELGIFNNGVIKDKFYIINHANMPSALVETAFLSNPDDRALLASPEWRQKIAQAIADGIGDYAGPPPPASPVSDR